MVDQINYNLLFHLHAGPVMDDATRNYAVLSKKIDCFVTYRASQLFFAGVNQRVKRSKSDDDFTVDGLLTQAVASQIVSTRRTA